MPTFTGTAGADEIIGSEGDDIIDGRNGEDRLYGRSGNDLIRGVLGATEVYGGSGDDTVIIVNPPDNGRYTGRILDGGDGVDTLDFSGVIATDTSFFATLTARTSLPNTYGLVFSNNGLPFSFDTVSNFERIIGANIPTIYDLGLITNVSFLQAGSANDRIYLGGSPTVRAGAGADTIFAYGTGGQFFGDDGADLFELGEPTTFDASALFDGGAGVDSLKFNLGTRSLNFRLGDGTLYGAVYRSIENVSIFSSVGFNTTQTINVTGSDADNVITLGGGESRTTGEVRAGAGNDTVSTFSAIVAFGGVGDDRMIVGGAAGIAYGEAGDDVLSGAGSLFGGDGDDMVSTVSVTAGNRYDGGSGIDIFQISGVNADSVSIDLAAGRVWRTLQGQVVQATISGFERVIAGSTIDTITLGSGNEYARGEAGADTLRGGAGNDVIYGDGLTETGFDGADQIFGDEGDDLLFGGGGNDTMAGGTGNDVLEGGAGTDVLDGGDGADLVVYDIARSAASISYADGAIRIEGLTGTIDTLRGVESIRFTDGVYDVVDGRVSATARAPLAGTAGNDRLVGTAAADILNGGAGNDVLRGGGGSDRLDGGTGIDAAQYGGTLQTYSTVSTSLVAGGVEGGFDQLSNIEVLRFLDGRLSFDTSDATSVVYRLYDAAFDRAPDVFGLADYARAISEGRATVQGILDVFAGSAEFQARYGALDNEQFVREMYRFSRNREGDAAGVASYVTALNNGTATRAQVLGVFSESSEHQTLTNAVIASRGLFVQDEQTASVARLYDSVFNRLPDLGGLKTYRDALDDGYSLRDIAAVLVASPEFQTRFGTLTNQQFVEQIYRFVLDREGDAAGVQSYVTALNNGASRTDVVLVLSESQEHRYGYQATYDSQIRQLGVNGYDPGAGAPTRDADKSHDAFIIPAIREDGPGGYAPPPFADVFRARGQDDRIVVVHEDGAADATPPLWPEDIRSLDLSAGHLHSDWL